MRNLSVNISNNLTKHIKDSFSGNLKDLNNMPRTDGISFRLI